ncbi:MAG: hypothetical protein J2P17_07925, partial [Mycobacterium sp.]|nr:hypothetical protein [Mycobacterium sp.]
LTNGAYICETPYGESGAWEPLVSVTTFKLAAERLQKRRTVRLGTWESSVRGRVRCSCGKLLKWQKPYNTVRGYCASRGTANPCPEAGHCVYERDVIAWFDRLAAGWLREGLSLSQFTTLPVNMEPVLRAEIAELEARLSRVGDRLDLGFIDRDRAKAEATAFRRSIREKEDQLAAIEPADPSLDSWGAQWVAAKPAERRALIGRIFESVTVDANGQVASWTARADRRAGAVDLLIATAFDSGAPEEDLALIPVAR